MQKYSDIKVCLCCINQSLANISIKDGKIVRKSIAARKMWFGSSLQCCLAYILYLVLSLHLRRIKIFLIKEIFLQVLMIYFYLFILISFLMNKGVNKVKIIMICCRFCKFWPDIQTYRIVFSLNVVDSVACQQYSMDIVGVNCTLIRENSSIWRMENFLEKRFIPEQKR